MAICSKFDAVPAHLRRTAKVKPFAIVPLSEQLARRTVPSVPVLHDLKALGNDANVHAIVIGGSWGKELNDAHSDLDVGIVADDADAAVAAVKTTFGVPEQTEDKLLSLALHYPSTNTPFARFEVRVSARRVIDELIEKIRAQVFLSQVEQDILANFYGGKFLHASGTFMAARQDIVYTDAQAHFDIEKSRELILDYDFKKLLSREDFTLYYYYLSVCKRALINVIYAKNRVFHLGYKHEKKLRSKLAAYPTALVEALDLCFAAPSVPNVDRFFKLLGPFLAEVTS